jgi:hypothetical protein
VAAPLLAVLSGVLLPFEPPYRSVANPPAVPALEDLLGAVAAMTVIVTGLGMLVAAWSLLVRFGRAHGVERQRLRWVALAAVLTVVVVLGIVAVAAAGLEAPVDWLVGVCLAVLPVAIGAAVLRYRLYDLDRIISRTLAYGLLTVLLGSGYAVVVLGLGQEGGHEGRGADQLDRYGACRCHPGRHLALARRALAPTSRLTHRWSRPRTGRRRICHPQRSQPTPSPSASRRCGSPY